MYDQLDLLLPPLAVLHYKIKISESPKFVYIIHHVLRYRLLVANELTYAATYPSTYSPSSDFRTIYMYILSLKYFTSCTPLLVFLYPPFLACIFSTI